MDYIKQDAAFEKWCRSHKLSIPAYALWKKLFQRFNISGWSEWITVDNLSLMADISVENKSTFLKYRDELITAGLIEYQKGHKSQPNKYRMSVLYEKGGIKNGSYSGNYVKNNFSPTKSGTDVGNVAKSKYGETL